jgi:hypothetical protein
MTTALCGLDCAPLLELAARDLRGDHDDLLGAELVGVDDGRGRLAGVLRRAAEDRLFGRSAVLGRDGDAVHGRHDRDTSARPRGSTRPLRGLDRLRTILQDYRHDMECLERRR